jgi:Rod binding domain-containing protein
MTPVNAVSTAPVNAEAAQAPDPRIVKAARDFEAIFVRQMLRSLEKTTSIGSGHQASGAGTYGSMVVNAMADAVSGAGGLGLSEVLVKHLSAAHPGLGQPAAPSDSNPTDPNKPLK